VSGEQVVVSEKLQYNIVCITTTCSPITFHYSPDLTMLKRLIAIMLLFIHLFNIGGQLAFYQYAVYQTEKIFNEQIGKNRYNVNDLTEIKIPVNMPNATDWQNYQSLSGQVQFKDASYNYVRIKITRTAIYLVCIPNYAATHLTDQNVICAKQIKDIPVPRKEHVQFGKITMMSYHYNAVSYMFSNPVTVFKKKPYYNFSIFLNCLIKGTGQPPDNFMFFPTRINAIG
jgi:hypothetical protein